VKNSKWAGLSQEIGFSAPNLYHLTLRSVSSLNNPQNTEMKFGENMEVDMLKIITIISNSML
jgi:hypothetical protein